MNSIISWVGGKKALRDLIYLRMPPQYDRYIEVFGGGGWVLFGKPPDKCMEVYNDFNSNLMERAAVGDVKRAAAFYKIIRYSYGSGCTSYGCQPFDIRKTFTIIWEANRRLKDTVIENKDFEALIRQYDRPNAFFYCDPPYYETEGHYEVVFRKEDHVRLRDTLKGIQGKFMVSYNDCEYIRELYRDFQIEAVTRINNMAQRYDSGSEFPEVLIANYDMGERKKNQPRQISLFEMGAEETSILWRGKEKECSS